MHQHGKTVILTFSANSERLKEVACVAWWRDGNRMTDSPATRQSLLVRLKDPKDGQAWAEFVAIYSPLIDRLARAKGFQAADAADLAQEVFRAVAGAIDRYDPDPERGSFRGWLFKIARNLMINLLAARRVRPQATGDSNVQEMLERVPAPDGAETALFDAEYRRRLFLWAAEQVRGEFRESTWRAFWLTAVEGVEAGAAATAAGISVGAVYIAKSRVMARLRSVIEQVDGESLS
jgi:RNA polymerase sigma factor (sigma-70 family)